ncbi:MAG: glycosyltransferase [Clostridia bacterium]|nr:glycosyltransferase [Clostridia bacterium]
MKITVVCDVLGEANNGTTLAALNLIKYLREAGHEVTVVAPDENAEGDKVCIVPPLRLGKFLDGVLKRNGVCLAKVDEKVLEEAMREADIVHVQVPLLLGCAAARVAKRLGKPLTASFHCQAENITAHLGLMNFKPANRLAYKTFYKKLYRYCDRVHYPTQFIREVFEKETFPTPAVVISNGVNESFFEEKEGERASDKFTILCCGRLSKEKAQWQLIKAVAKSKYREDITVLLAGDGPYKKRLQKLARKNGVDCRQSFYKIEELQAVMRGADLYVHTALIEIEAIACLEGIVSGLVPVVCNSPRSATRFFALSRQNLFQPKNVRDLTAKIEYWIENPEEKAKCKERYKEFKMQFSQGICMRQMEEMMLSVVEERVREQKGAKP